MDLRTAVHQFVNDGRDLLKRFQTDEGTSLTSAELHMLKVQLYLLDHHIIRMNKEPRPKKLSRSDHL
jgi:hypothetical protein